MQELAKEVQLWLDQGQRSAVGRVVDIQGFSNWGGDPIIVVNEAGDQRGDVLGRIGAAQVREGARALWTGGGGVGLQQVTIQIQGDAIAEAGLSCGGQADVLLQSTSEVPGELWMALANRVPVALVTRIAGPTAGSPALVVQLDGTWAGTLPAGDDGALAAMAVELLRSGQTVSRRVEDAEGDLLIEAWVPQPRLVVVGTGDLVEALAAQAVLLGWESQGGQTVEEVDRLLAWGGASACLVVLSHDPEVDTPVLAAALRGGAAYVGAMGSRRTQSGRTERLLAVGIDQSDLDRIRRPIGLDLGGRRAPEMALAICAEILAVHCGRDGRPLKDRSGPINSRPATPAVR